MIHPVCRKFLSYGVDLICRRGDARYCPICQRRSWRFTSFGVIRRPDARCPWCGSLERHRCEWLYLLRRTDLLDGRNKAVLHVAPEPCLEILLRGHFGLNYITADLFEPHIMVKMDVMNIPFAPNRFDVLLCSHVLLDVLDDRRALSEFYRVLKPSGWAIFLEHIQANPTFEDASIVDPVDRLREYGHHDHVRRYGPDFIDRMREAGFIAKAVAPHEFITPMELRLCGMTKSVDDIYYCVKPKADK